MNKYKRVQFISWELHTGPCKESLEVVVKGQKPPFYNGLLHESATDKRLDVPGQIWDIEARVNFTSEAIKTALAKSVDDAETLKVFMAPEFLYRGAGGAYVHDLINGWVSGAPAQCEVPDRYKEHWTGLFGELSELVAKPAYEHWLFVFGTALSASFPTLKKAGSPIDLTQKGEIYNTALIQRGGPGHSQENYVSRKHYKSHIDFVRQYSALPHHTNDNVDPLEKEDLVPKEDVAEGGATFQIASICDPNGAPIDFGIEICLDHAQSGGNRSNDYGRIRTAGKRVQIQLVPSGGMSLEADSIWLKSATSYTFNCEGQNTLDLTSGSHTQVWDRAATPIVEASNGEVRAKSQVFPVADQVDTSIRRVLAKELWNRGNGVCGAGKVRIIDALPL